MRTHRASPMGARRNRARIEPATERSPALLQRPWTAPATAGARSRRIGTEAWGPSLVATQEVGGFHVHSGGQPGGPSPEPPKSGNERLEQSPRDTQLGMLLGRRAVIRGTTRR